MLAKGEARQILDEPRDLAPEGDIFRGEEAHATRGRGDAPQRARELLHRAIGSQRGWHRTAVNPNMIKNTKPIAQFMSAAPICAQLETTLAAAEQLLEQHDIRHLPVLDGTKLVGVVSERDLAVVESLVPDDWERFRVGEAMTPKPYTVSPDTPLCDVARAMADHKYGCALVVESSGELVGLFSTIDALRILAGDE